MRKYLPPIQRILSSTLMQCSIGAAIGLTIFVYLFGINTLNPLNINWLQNSEGDLIQHYIGWLYFKEAPWSFPIIGHISELAYPNGIPLAYLDVVPLFAIFFKIFGGILPDHFQYFGLFTLLSFMLQGVFAVLLFRRFTDRTILVFIGSLFIILTPIIISRSFAHTALTAQWLVLLAIYLAVTIYQDNILLKKQIIIWSIVLSLGVLTHAYFIPILASIFLFSAIVQHKKVSSTILLLLIPISAALIIFGAIGGFASGMETNGSSGLGLYSLNALGPILPMGYSHFIESTFVHVPWEGLAYFGLGFILLSPVAWFVLLQKHQTKLASPIKLIKRLRISRRQILLFSLVLCVFIFSLSPIIYLGDVNPLVIPTPGAVGDIWEIFRATGRLFWPIYYAIILFLLVYIFKIAEKMNTKIIILLFLPFIAIQAIDILRSPATLGKRESVAELVKSQHQLNKLNGGLVGDHCNKDTLILLDKTIESGIKMFHDLPDYILTCQPKLTTGYFARFPKKSILNYVERQREAIQKGARLDDSRLYISQDSDYVRTVDLERYKISQAGDYFIINNR